MPIVGILCNNNTDEIDPCEDTLHIAQSLKANEEVESIFWIPLTFFLDKNRISFVEVPFKIDESLKNEYAFKTKPIHTFNRPVVQLDDWPFEKDTKPLNTILYGINAIILMSNVLILSENKFTLLDSPSFRINNQDEFLNFLTIFRYTAFFVYKNMKLAKEKKSKQVKSNL